MTPSKPVLDGEPASSIWPLTIWSEVRQAGQEVGKDADRLNALILRYHPPLRIHLAASFPKLGPHHDELIQNFSQDRILRDGWLLKADQERGKFRNFLKTSLTNYVICWIREAKRHGRLESLDDEENPNRPNLEAQVVTPSAEDRFNLEWLRAILTETLRRTEDDCRKPGKQQPKRSHIWEIFSLRILNPILQETQPPSYDELVHMFGLKSPTEGTNMLLSAKRIFERHLKAVVGEYEQQDRATQFEIAELKESLLKLVNVE